MGREVETLHFSLRGPRSVEARFGTDGAGQGPGCVSIHYVLMAWLEWVSGSPLTPECQIGPYLIVEEADDRTIRVFLLT